MASVQLYGQKDSCIERGRQFLLHTAARRVGWLSVNRVLDLQFVVEIRGGGVYQGQSSLLGGTDDHCTTFHY